jgi:hypothetical protein
MIQSIGLSDRFLALFGGKFGEAPIMQQSIMQPILIDRPKLMLLCLIQYVDDFRLTLHDFLRGSVVEKSDAVFSVVVVKSEAGNFHAFRLLIENLNSKKTLT